jgi:hypothetical protein
MVKIVKVPADQPKRRPQPKQPEAEPLVAVVARPTPGQGQWTKLPGGVYGVVHDPWGD